MVAKLHESADVQLDGHAVSAPDVVRVRDNAHAGAVVEQNVTKIFIQRPMLDDKRLVAAFDISLVPRHLNHLLLAGIGVDAGEALDLESEEVARGNALEVTLNKRLPGHPLWAEGIIQQAVLHHDAADSLPGKPYNQFLNSPWIGPDYHRPSKHQVADHVRLGRHRPSLPRRPEPSYLRATSVQCHFNSVSAEEKRAELAQQVLADLHGRFCEATLLGNIEDDPLVAEFLL